MAVIDAVYVRVMPGVNAPNEAGVPSVSASVAGTVPPTGAVGSVNAPASVIAAVPPTIGSETLLARVSSVIGCAGLADDGMPLEAVPPYRLPTTMMPMR